MRSIPAAALIASLMVVAPLAAQSGVVRYDRATRIDIDLPQYSPMRGRIPKASIRPMQLRYSGDATLFEPAPAESDQKKGASPKPLATREAMVISGSDIAMIRGAMAFRIGGAMGGANDEVIGAFTNLEGDGYIEVRKFLGRTFRIKEERPSFDWKLTGEQASFLGHPVYQAVAQQDSTSIEAWFTPDIPIPAGPAQYGGLPGLILTLAVDSNLVVYTATAIDTAAANNKIEAPTDGRELSRAEYDQVVKEKEAEIRKSRRGPGEE